MAIAKSPLAPQSLGQRAAGPWQGLDGEGLGENGAGKELLPLPAPSPAVSEGNVPEDALADRKDLALMAY